jgi:hypothetical protein
MEVDKWRKCLDERTEVVVRRCIKDGLSLEQTQKEVLSDPAREFLLNRIVKIQIFSITPDILLQETA